MIDPNFAPNFANPEARNFFKATKDCLPVRNINCTNTTKMKNKLPEFFF